MKNINELPKTARSFLDSLNYGLNESSKGIYYKFTGYHANGKKVEEMIPEGFKMVKFMQVWSEIKRTSINVMMIEELK